MVRAERKAKPSRPRDGGFTLLEVIIALTIATMAFVTMMGLQSAALTATVRNGNRDQAILLLRRILAFVEINEDTIPESNKEGTPSELLDLVSDGKAGPVDSELDARYSVSWALEKWEVPVVPENSVQRLTLGISWGSNPADRISIIYFIAKDPGS